MSRTQKYEKEVEGADQADPACKTRLAFFPNIEGKLFEVLATSQYDGVSLSGLSEDGMRLNFGDWDDPPETLESGAMVIGLGDVFYRVLRDPADATEKYLKVLSTKGVGWILKGRLSRAGS